MLQSFKTRFKRKLDQNMLENAYFLKKLEKSPQRWGLRPKSPMASGSWGL